MKDFYETAIALRQKYLAEDDLYYELKRGIISQIVKAVFENEEKPLSYLIVQLLEDYDCWGVAQFIDITHEILSALSIELDPYGAEFINGIYCLRFRSVENVEK